MFETFSNWQTKHWININQLHVWPMPMTNAGLRNQIQWRNKNTQHLLWSRSKNCMRHAGLCLKLNLIPTSLFVLYRNQENIYTGQTTLQKHFRDSSCDFTHTRQGASTKTDTTTHEWQKKHVSCYGGFGSNYSVSSFWKFVNLSKCGNGTNRTDKRVNFCGLYER